MKVAEIIGLTLIAGAGLYIGYKTRKAIENPRDAMGGVGEISLNPLNPDNLFKRQVDDYLSSILQPNSTLGGDVVYPWLQSDNAFRDECITSSNGYWVQDGAGGHCEYR